MPPEGIDITEHFTTDTHNFGEIAPDEFLAHFQELGAIKYAADGCGLNFVSQEDSDFTAISRREFESTEDSAAN